MTDRRDLPMTTAYEALERIARFAEAYDAVTQDYDFTKEIVGSCLAIVLGKYARRILEENEYGLAKSLHEHGEENQ